MTEQSSKQDYLRYFGNKKPNHKSKHKLLPHIAEEYNYRITNHLLLKKIISPKRDKTIMHSIQSVPKKGTPLRHRSTHSRTPSRQNTSIKRNRSRQITRQAKENQLQDTPTPVKHNTTVSFNTAPSLDKQNSVQISKSYQQRSWTQKRGSRSQHILGCKTQSKQHTQQSFYCRFLNQTSSSFGKGPTILYITSLQINSNPLIKLDTLVEIELIERPAFVTKIKNIQFSRQQLVVKSCPIPYGNLITQNKQSTLKFCLKVSKIGDFVPLRIWKYSGVESHELGVIDLPLSPQRDSADGHALWQKGIAGGFRRVLFGTTKGKLRKGKGQSQTQVIVKYRIYPKKYPKQLQESQKAIES